MEKPSEFYEVQKYTQWWIWTIVIASVLLITGINIHAAYHQFILGEPWGDEPMSDVGLAVFMFFTTLVMIVMLWIFTVSKLEIKIDKHGIHYRYFPWIPNWKFIPKENIRKWTVKKYFVLGYGIRFGFQFKTLNVRGNTGLELKLHSGKNLRLGTQKPEDIRRVMENFFSKEGG